MKERLEGEQSASVWKDKYEVMRIECLKTKNTLNNYLLKHKDDLTVFGKPLEETPDDETIKSTWKRE